MTLITGNTYPHRDALRQMDGTWDSRLKGWWVPDHHAQQAQALVGGPTSHSVGRRSGHCRTCGGGIRYGEYCGKCEYSR